MLDIIDTRSMTVVERVTLAGSLDGIALDTTQHVLYVASTAGGIYRIDANTGAIQLAATDSGMPQDLTLSPDGARLFVANESGWVLVLDPASLSELQRFTVPAAFGVAVTPDGTQLWITEPQASRMEILDAATGALVATRPSNAEPQRMAFNASGSIAVVTNTFDLVQFME